MTPPAPPGYPPPPPPSRPRRRRPSRWWFAVAVIVLLGSVGGGIAGLVYTTMETFGTDGTVTADGSTQPIVTDAGAEAMIWVTAGETEQCDIIDSETDREVRRTPLFGSFTKATGGREWVGVGRFESGSGRLDVTCEPGSSDIQIGPASDIGPLVGSFMLFLGLLILGGLTGLVMLIVLVILYVTGRPRHEPAG